MTTLKEFHKLFTDLMNTTWTVDGTEYNLTQRGWTMGYNKRKRALGVCRMGLRKIEISKPNLENNLDTLHEFEDVVRHEIAHAIDCIKRGTSDHGYKWKAVCVQVGADPSRLYEGEEIKEPQGKYTLTCGNCGHEGQMHRKPKGSSYACGKCVKKYGRHRIKEFALTIKRNW